MLALRHVVPVADVTFDGIMQVATVLAHTASRFSPALTERSRTRSACASSTFAYVTE
jgi:hypothetical protein